MTDQIPDVDETPASDDAAGAQPGGGWRAWLGRRDSHGRPMGVYLILAAGVLTLIALMLVIYLWSGDRGREDQPICTTIAADQAHLAIIEGQVERFSLVYSSEIVTPEADGWGPVQARLDYTDGRCANLPQGVEHQPALYGILGSITFYNETTEGAQIEVKYSGLAGLDAVLFEAATAEPTETPEVPAETPPATPEVTPTPSPTEVPATPAATPGGTPTSQASPAADPPSPPATP